MRILITSVGTATAVNLIKHIKRETKHVVIGTDINPYGYTAGSTMCDVFYQVPYAVDSGYIGTVKQIIDYQSIDALIPINDIEIKIISSSELCHSNNVRCLVPTTDVINIVSDKYNCNEAAAHLGLNIAEYCNSAEPVKKIRRDKIGVGSKGVKVFEPNEIVYPYDSSIQIIQKYIEGEEYTIDCLCDEDGNPIFIIPRKRLEVKSGVATKVLIEKNDSLIDYSKALLENIKIPGFSNIQFIVDKDKKAWFIEVNPRFSGCGAATALACERFIPTFFEIIERNNSNVKSADSIAINNGSIRWNSIVTRYYEEKIWWP